MTMVWWGESSPVFGKEEKGLSGSGWTDSKLLCRGSR